jgi:hypothetical protein
VSRVNLDTPDDVISFLRILAEESVDSAQEIMANRMKRDEKLYGPLDEADPPEEEVDVEEEEEEVITTDDEEASLEVSMDSISDAIKQLRSGRSVDDSVMKTQLRTYFNRLEEAERSALLAFLTAFSGILTGVASGADAPDPSEDPYNITMTYGETPSEVEDVAAPTFGEDEEEEEEEEEEEVVSEPADKPPIRAGKSQSLREIRRRVRALMSAR